MFWIWNGGHEVINTPQITYMSILEEKPDTEIDPTEENAYAEVWLADKTNCPIELNREQYLDLIKFIQNHQRA